MAVEAVPRLASSVVPALFGAGVAAQIAYPLLGGAARDRLTVAIVLLVAAGSLVHAGLTRGARTAAVLAATTAGGGFAVELLGVHTGVPFGTYRYENTLGPAVVGVPVIIALAWTMLAWPAALAARRLCRGTVARIAVGGWALAAWDVYLDPQMVAAGHWSWTGTAAHLPGVPLVPLSDYAGWLLVAVAMSAVLQTGLRGIPDGDDRWPLAFYVWTWVSSALALAAFLGLGAAALWGALAMGAVALPLLRSAGR